MKIVLKKKKIYLVVTLSLFCLLFLAAGIYLLIGNKSLFTKYSIDKYPDVNNWCTSSTEADTLSISCNGLLLSIQNTGDNNSCFDIQIITNNKELKNLTICENSSNLEYTNDILGYKVLMPISIKFSYTKKFMNSYTFQSVSFDKMDESYIQSIVNEDIANLVTIDPNSTTIRNSVDFCPIAEKLPNYISEENKKNYSDYLNRNTLSEDTYNDEDLYNSTGSAIQMLFACDSVSNLSYGSICNRNKANNIAIQPNIARLNNSPMWGKDMDNNDISQLRTISSIYDGFYYKSQKNNTNITLLKNLVDEINGQESLSEEVFCSMYKLYSVLAKYNTTFATDDDYINHMLSMHITDIHSSACFDVVSKNGTSFSKTGMYILSVLNQFDTQLAFRCNNLNILLTNE